jgi:hypothetical protein
MVITGFRPGSRSTFVWAKVDKAIDAQFGHIGWDGRAEEERTNSLRSNKARRKQRASDPRAEQQASEFRMERQIYKRQALESILNDYKAPILKKSQLSDHGFSLFGRRALFEMNLFGSAVA